MVMRAVLCVWYCIRICTSLVLWRLAFNAFSLPLSSLLAARPACLDPFHPRCLLTPIPLYVYRSLSSIPFTIPAPTPSTYPQECQLLLDAGVAPNSNSASRAIGYRQALTFLQRCHDDPKAATEGSVVSWRIVLGGSGGGGGGGALCWRCSVLAGVVVMMAAFALLLIAGGAALAQMLLPCPPPAIRVTPSYLPILHSFSSHPPNAHPCRSSW
jgi:hypothetical protein